MLIDSVWKLAHRWMPGASWQNPVVNGALRLLDPVDALARRSRGLSDLPSYSIRVRSNGVRGQFGGATFAERGAHFVELLRTHADLRKDARVLEIGCGCGRIAIALARYLEGGTYTGVDIDPIVIKACEDNAAFDSRPFTFKLLSVQNDEYNRTGSDRAESFRFPYADSSFDTIFLVSVFTHMLPDAVANYVQEIGRLLVPGGRCVFTAFLMDFGTSGPRRDFAFDRGSYRTIHATLPEKAVGYQSAFFDEAFARAGARAVRSPRLGSWRGGESVRPTIDFPQDVLVYERKVPPSR